jgi:phosphoserine phosphatase RsbU/P
MLPSGGIGLVIADVCDKGVGSALFMALFRSLIRVFSSNIDLVGSVAIAPTQTNSSTAQQPLTINLDHVNALNAVRLTNDYVAENHSNLNMFATLFFGVLDSKTGTLTYVNGGHEPLVILNASGIRARLKPTGPAVGMMPNMKFRVQQICLEPGDMLVGYTDGVTEAKSPESKFFTEHRFIELLADPPETATALLERIESHLTKHIDTADQFDDITMLAVRRAPLVE